MSTIAAELERDPEAPNPDLKSILKGDVADAQPPFDKIAGHAFFNGKHLDE